MYTINEECSNINKIFKEYDFPDIERNFYNLLSDLVFEQSFDFEQYVGIKIESLIRDLVLYSENFITDWYDILYKVESIVNRSNGHIELDTGLKLLGEFLDEIGLTDELYFIEAIILFLQQHKIVESKLNKIKNESLRKFGYDYIANLKVG